MAEIKECFVSRFAPEGVLLEADFSQLEVVGLAVLSGDPVLKDDIKSGRDMHRTRAAELFDIPESKVSDEQRRAAKAFSFMLQYGSGAKGMAHKTGLPLHLARKFINNYYDRYKEVLNWQEYIAECVKSSRMPTGRHTPKKYPQGTGHYTSPTGRTYRFFEYDAPEGFKRSEPGFSPTEMKNYPVQGFATGDIMALYRGKVYRRLLDEYWTGRVLTVNTVHDSIMFDVANSECAADLKVLLENEAKRIPSQLRSLWGIETDLEFKIECKAGPTWATLTKMED